MECKEENCSDEIDDVSDGNDPPKGSNKENVQVSPAKSEEFEETDQFHESSCVDEELFTMLTFVDDGVGEKLEVITLQETVAVMAEAEGSHPDFNEGEVLELAFNASNDIVTHESGSDLPDRKQKSKDSDVDVEECSLEQEQLPNHASVSESSMIGASGLPPPVKYIVQQEANLCISIEGCDRTDEARESSDAAQFTFSRSALFKLPPEILLKIFSYLSLEDVCLRIAPLCRYCYHLSRDPSLWRHVCIFRSCSLESAFILLSHATQAEVLHIANHAYIEPILNSQCVSSSAKTLTCLDLGFSEISVSVVKTTFSTDLPRLVHLNLEGCRFLDKNTLEMIIPRLSKRMKRISLSHCFILADESLTYIFEYLPNLTHLNLDGVEWISDKGVKIIVDQLGSILQALWLDGENLTNTSCEQVARCQCLKLLSIRYCEGFTDILPLREMSTLRSLSIRKNSEIDRKQVKELFDLKESRLSALNYLDISECYAINDDVVGVICGLCGPHLLYLMLEWCWEVTDVGIQKIAESCPHLIRLCLNGMHNLIGQPFACIPSVFPHLSVLNLTNCNSICDELIQKVVDQNPHLIVFTYYGERFETVGAVLPELSTEHDLWRIPVPGQTRICDC